MTNIDPNLFGVNEVYLIEQMGKENFLAEEKQIAEALGVEYVNFDQDFGVYKESTDAVKVAKALKAAKPERELRVRKCYGVRKN